MHLTERKWADAGSIPAAELCAHWRISLATALRPCSIYRRRTPTRRFSAGASLRTKVSGPRILFVGEGIVPLGGAPPEIVSNLLGWMRVPLHEVADPAQAATAARLLIDRGVDAIKMFASGPPSVPGSKLSRDSMRAIVAVGRAARKPIFLHPNTAEDALDGVAASVDVLAHTIPRHPEWKDVCAAAIDAGTALTPTLALWKHATRHDRVSSQKQLVNAAVEQLAAFRAASGTILFGTDFGAADPDPADEYRLMARGGMAFCDILASLTTAPSQRFLGSARAGTVSIGEAADIVVLNRYPTSDPAAFCDVRLTMRGGRILYSA